MPCFLVIPVMAMAALTVASLVTHRTSFSVQRQTSCGRSQTRKREDRQRDIFLKPATSSTWVSADYTQLLPALSEHSSHNEEGTLRGSEGSPYMANKKRGQPDFKEEQLRCNPQRFPRKCRLPRILACFFT